MTEYKQQLINGMRLWKSLGYTITLTGGPKGNIGILKGWPDTDLTETELEHQIRTNHRCTGIAIVTNNLCVFDLDGEEGINNWADLTHQHTLKEPTLIQYTPSGGQHWLYQTTPDTRWGTSANLLAPKVDVRAERGLIAVWPTIRQNGTRYELNEQPCHINELPQAPTPWTTNQIGTPGNTAPLPEGVTDIRERFNRDTGNYHCPAHTDQHGSLSIRYMQDQAWAIKCFSGCTTQNILKAAGLTTKDLYPKQSDLIEDTFGPNPCHSFNLTHEDGTTIDMQCNGKRCVDCGPRKKAVMWEQTKNTLGENVYVARFEPGESLEELRKGLERAKKDSQRRGIPTAFTIVGDDTSGHIVLSDRPICPTQRRMALAPWRKRVLDLWHQSVKRLRRSRVFGSVSLGAIRRKRSKGQPSQWRFQKAHVNAYEAMKQAEIDERDALTADIGWHVWEENGRLLSTMDLWRS